MTGDRAVHAGPRVPTTTTVTVEQTPEILMALSPSPLSPCRKVVPFTQNKQGNGGDDGTGAVWRLLEVTTDDDDVVIAAIHCNQPGQSSCDLSVKCITTINHIIPPSYRLRFCFVDLKYEQQQ